MVEAVLIYGKNIPIRLSGNSTSINGGSYSISPTTYGLTGKLSEFNLNSTHYIYVSEINFYQGHASESRSGYVKEMAYEEYRKTKNLANLKKTDNWFDEFEFVKEGDLFKIEKVEFNGYETANYSKYFILKKAKFRINNLQIDFSNFNEYPPENLNSSSPNYCEIEIYDADIQNSYSTIDEGHFFTKNFKNKINTVTIGDAAKEVIYEGIIKICFRIHYIVKDVLEILAFATLSEIKTFLGSISSGNNARVQINSATTLPSGLKFTRTDKAIAHLLLDWGYKDFASTQELPLEVGSEQFYGGFYTPYENYYNAVVNFYYNLIGKDENLIFNPPAGAPISWLSTDLEAQDVKRMQYLSTILPASAITLLSIDERIRILQDFATGNITGNKEDIVLKIFQSIPINHQDATYFLNKLQTTMIVDGSKQYTLFEKLYDKINDSILFFGEDNRQTLMLNTFMLWFISAFNPAINTNDFEDITTQDLDAIDAALQGYQSDPVIIPYSSEKSFGFYIDNMQFEFVAGKISVNQEKIKIAPTYNANQNPVQKYYETLGAYKYFQAVSLSQYKEDDVAIKIPFVDINQPGQEKTAILPLFFLKYMDDYGDTQDLWNGIGLALDIGLTFTGVGNITKLRHLRHLGKFGRAYRAYKRGSQTAEVLFTIKGVWTGVQGAAALIEVSSSLVSAYLSYYTGNCSIYKNHVTANINDTTPQGQVPDDSQQNNEYKRCKKLDEILFWIQIGSLGLDVLASKMIRKRAKELSDLGFPQEFDNHPLLKQWFNDLDGAESDNYSNFLQQIPSISRQVIETKLLPNATFQKKFLDDFGALGNDELLAMMELMAKNNGAAVDNWLLMLQNTIEEERKLLAYLESSTLTNSLIRYYDESSLKNILKNLEESKKQFFLKEFGNVNSDLFNKFLEKPQAIKRWSTAPSQTKLIAKKDPELWLYIVDDLPIGTNFSKVPGSSKWELVDLDGIVHFRAELNGPPPKINFASYKKFKKLSVLQQANIQNQIKSTFRSGSVSSGNAYISTKSHLGKQIPRSNNGMGVSPDFKNLEMAFHPSPPPYILGNGIPNISGLTESFGSIIQKIKSTGGEVKIPITGQGDRAVDFRNAWKKMGINYKDGEVLMKELEMTWHHVDDLDINMNSTLQLVTRKAHRITIPHSGSVKESDILYDYINNNL
ncbi:HNH endonuclease [Kaistella sp. PBT33-4]|uniref:HNH endonuclease n=1 Tax=Kaistella sp. PBT33-4 TaxID=3032000 RepID=UPI0023D8B45B|nr:HNH endonuclease [Kaistella sp. PBT33-4]MDF0720567.1 HNH endonuclease [Kaistella sp. PBT33-4]